MKKVRFRPRNLAARALREPQFRKQVVRLKTTYSRKGKTRHRIGNDGGHYEARDSKLKKNHESFVFKKRATLAHPLLGVLGLEFIMRLINKTPHPVHILDGMGKVLAAFAIASTPASLTPAMIAGWTGCGRRSDTSSASACFRSATSRQKKSARVSTTWCTISWMLSTTDARRSPASR